MLRGRDTFRHSLRNIMNAILLNRFNDRLTLAETDDPGPLAPGEVVLEIEAAGVCFKDLLIVEGFQPRVKLPVVLGHEAAGRICAIGPDADGFRVGDLVCSLPYIP